jgi:hypothetical protein
MGLLITEHSEFGLSSVPMLISVYSVTVVLTMDFGYSLIIQAMHSVAGLLFPTILTLGAA